MYLELKGIENNIAHDYVLFKSDWVADNMESFVLDSKLAHSRFDYAFSHNNIGSTWNYRYYNIFNLTVDSVLFYGLYKQIMKAIRFKVGDDRPLWFQSWLNLHVPGSIKELSWHNHVGSIYHGYISIDPKNSTTRFDNYAVKNEPGLMYIGPGDRFHEVIIHEPFDTPRVTLAFDIWGSWEVPRHDTLDVSLAAIPVP